MQESKIKSTIETLASLGQLDALIALRNSLKHDFELATAAINSLTNSQSSEIPTRDVKTSNTKVIGYNKDWSLPDKFLFILQRENKFIRFREAAKMIVDIEGAGDEDYFTKRLTTSTRKLKLDGKIVKVSHEDSLKNTFWGSSKWIDKDGNIKPEYKYDEESIISNESVSSSRLFDDI
jgi:hypothetical protein